MKTTLCILAALLCGCQTPRLATPSGSPEVTISNTDVDPVKTAFAGYDYSGGGFETSSTIQSDPEVSPPKSTKSPRAQ